MCGNPSRMSDPSDSHRTPVRAGPLAHMRHIHVQMRHADERHFLRTILTCDPFSYANHSHPGAAGQVRTRRMCDPVSTANHSQLRSIHMCEPFSSVYDSQVRTLLIREPFSSAIHSQLAGYAALQHGPPVVHCNIGGHPPRSGRGGVSYVHMDS